MTGARDELAAIHTFPQLIRYLRDELDWPVASDDFEELTFDYDAADLGIDAHSAANIQEIKRLRPLSVNQPWGVFFVKFEPKRLPVVALRRILGSFVLKKRASASGADRTRWDTEDLLFISTYGEGEQRQISFAHFAQDVGSGQLPTLKVLGWDGLDTVLHVEHVAETLRNDLRWPDNESDAQAWREMWRSAFTLRNREVVTTSRDLAVRLAALARGIRVLIRSGLAIETASGPLTKLMKAFQESLIHDLKADDFADMYAQTIAYGLLSARIANPQARHGGPAIELPVTNPFLKELLATFLSVETGDDGGGGSAIDFDELGVSEVIQLLDDADMEAVVRDFGDRNPQEDPVIHFYELFLKEYDAKKRMQRGVFYTPRPVVSYIVNTVDEALRTEFGLEDGLADTATWGEMTRRHPGLQVPDGMAPADAFVQILDPATGTGTFLVEVIDVVHKTLVTRWAQAGRSDTEIGALWNRYVSEHLLTRLHGYELLMAPYAIAHLKLGIKLIETGYRFESDERLRVYLTNSLELATTKQLSLGFFPALAHEAHAVNEIKRTRRFTVVVGNPPYATVSQNMSDLARTSIAVYLQDDRGPIEEKSNRNHLQDDYVKFLRRSELILEETGIGVLGMITNGSFLSSDWFRGMRFQLMKRFRRIDVLDLHGGVREHLPRDENVFDIRQNVAISLMVDTPRSWDGPSGVRYAELRGPRRVKYEQLLSRERVAAHEISPERSNRWSFNPMESSEHGAKPAGISIVKVFTEWGYGAKTNRDGLAVAFTEAELLAKIRDFASNDAKDEWLEAKYGFGSNYQWTTAAARERLRRDGVERSRVTPYLFRPFDQRFVYWHPAVVFNMRGEKLEVFREPNPPLGLLFSRSSRREQPTNFFVTRSLVDCHCIEDANVAPARTAEPANSWQQSLLLDRPNEHGSSNIDVSFLVDAMSRQGGHEAFGPDDVFGYIYALWHSPQYRAVHRVELRRDRPVVLLPGSPSLLSRLAQIGRDLVALHLMESPRLAAPITSYTGPEKPQVGRIGWSDGGVWLDAPYPRSGRPSEPGTVGFRGVPEDVWTFEVGSYQVCEKWLKDRKGRALTADDIVHYQKIVVAIAETIRLMAEVDSVIEEHGGWPGAFAIPT